MAEEWFDVVDAADCVVGMALRAEVHARGLLHRAVHILLERADGAIFLQKRSMSKDSAPGKWDSSASGHLDSGEGYRAAALREVEEELGVRVPTLEEIGRLPASVETGQEFVRIYRGRHEGPFVLNAEEIAEGGWYLPERIDQWLAAEPEAFARCFRSVWAVWRG